MSHNSISFSYIYVLHFIYYSFIGWNNKNSKYNPCTCAMDPELRPQSCIIQKTGHVQEEGSFEILEILLNRHFALARSSAWQLDGSVSGKRALFIGCCITGVKCFRANEKKDLRYRRAPPDGNMNLEILLSSTSSFFTSLRVLTFNAITSLYSESRSDAHYKS